MNPKRFIIWRRARHELRDLGTLEQKLREASAIVESEEEDAVVVVEVKKVIRSRRAPVVVEDY